MLKETQHMKQESLGFWGDLYTWVVNTYLVVFDIWKLKKKKEKKKGKKYFVTFLLFKKIPVSFQDEEAPSDITNNRNKWVWQHK